MSGNDVVAEWDIPLSNGLHNVQFEHGTTTGKRIIRVDGKELFHQEWMFKLVGSETFEIDKHKCKIHILPEGSFSYQYSLEVDGKSYKKFTENQSKIMRTWVFPLKGEMCRVVLEKDTLDVWVCGRKVEIASEFVDDGTEMHFEVSDTPAYIKTVSSGNRREGLIYNLIVGNTIIPESVE